MKPNETPEKIYVHRSFHLGLLTASEINITGSDVEYTRTDAFIEKTISWLRESITNNLECNRIISKKGVITMGLLIEDFKNYMKGE